MNEVIERFFTLATHYNFSTHNKILSFKLERGYVTFYRHLGSWHSEETKFPHFSEYKPISSLNTAAKIDKFCQDCEASPHVNRYVPIVT